MANRDADIPQYYLGRLRSLLADLAEKTMPAILEAGRRIARSIAGGGTIHVFGAGHSHMVADEAFYRAGGLTHVDPIIDESLLAYHSPIKATLAERLPGYADVVLSDRDLRPNDVLIVASHSGRNAVPVEAAIAARRRGLFVIAITSLPHSSAVSPRSPEGKRLFEVADLVIDTGAPFGDAVSRINGIEPAMGPVSTILSLAALNAMLLSAASFLAAEGRPPQVFVSANVGVDSPRHEAEGEALPMGMRDTFVVHQYIRMEQRENSTK